jgi:hypothetical protein
MSLPIDRVVKVRKWLSYANITIDLHKTPYCLTPEGQKALFRLIYTYITNHRNSERIAKQSFAFGPDIIAFTVLTRDLEKIQKTITAIFKDPSSLTENKLETPVPLSSLLFPFFTVKKQKIWRIGAVSEEA